MADPPLWHEHFASLPSLTAHQCNHRLSLHEPSKMNGGVVLAVTCFSFSPPQEYSSPLSLCPVVATTGSHVCAGGDRGTGISSPGRGGWVSVSPRPLTPSKGGDREALKGVAVSMMAPAADSWSIRWTSSGSRVIDGYATRNSAGQGRGLVLPSCCDIFFFICLFSLLLLLVHPSLFGDKYMYVDILDHLSPFLALQLRAPSSFVAKDFSFFFFSISLRFPVYSLIRIISFELCGRAQISC
jgi:hypothetical protein